MSSGSFRTVSFRSRVLPPNSVWMEDAKLKGLEICHPQVRGRSGMRDKIHRKRHDVFKASYLNTEVKFKMETRRYVLFILNYTRFRSFVPNTSSNTQFTKKIEVVENVSCLNPVSLCLCSRREISSTGYLEVFWWGKPMSWAGPTPAPTGESL